MIAGALARTLEEAAPRDDLPRDAAAPDIALTRIAVRGIAADSPLARQLAEALTDIAEVLPAGEQPAGGWLWRRYVRNTALDGFGAPHPIPGPKPDLVLALQGHHTTGEIPLWRVVDEFGNPVMQPFGCLAGADGVLSLYLLETRLGAPEQYVLAEAHLRGWRHYRGLLDTVGRTVAWLVANALRARPAHPAAMTSPPQPPGASRFAADRIARLRLWLRERIAADIWAIGHITAPPQKFLNSQTVVPDAWLEIPLQDGFIADPFPWPGRPDAILYERFTHRTGLGTLEALTAGDGAAQPLDMPVRSHLSYPYAYVEGDAVFCLPEMAAERRQALYVLEPDGALRERAIIAEDVAMADPTLFRYAGHYWIAYNDVSLGLHENLCLRFADRLEGPWRPHPLNPVKIDIRSSRPGGTPFRVGETLFRPAQDCSLGYGCALAINRIVDCTPERYQEVAVARLTPDPNGRYPHGIHTFSVTSDGVLLDGKRIVYSGGILLQRLRRWLRSAMHAA